MVIWESSYAPTANLPIDPKSPDGKTRVAIEKGTIPKKNFYTHNFVDRTSWYSRSVRVENELATRTGVGVYQLAHTFVIDTGHGKVFQERVLREGSNSYRVLVTVDGVPQVERDPHYASPQPGEHFTLDYATGTITFLADPGEGAEVRTTYYYATTSEFILRPDTGKQLNIIRAEAQFSVPINPLDTVIFEVRGYAGVFAPHLVGQNILQATDKVPLESFYYQTLGDYQADAMASYPTYPPMGEPGNWRSIPYPVTVFDWAYNEATPISDRAGMEVAVFLEHDVPFEGFLASVTFYCSQVDE